MEIRKIKLDEIEKLRTLYNYLNFEEFKHQLINDVLEHKKDVYVISKDNELIGEITVYYDLDYIATQKNIRVYLSAFRIKKEFQNQGLGQRLLKYVINELEIKGITEFTIGVEDDNEIAKHIYEKYDFTEVIDRREEKTNKGIYEYNLLLKKSNDKKIEKLIKKFNLADKVESITQIHGGLSNRMYKVMTDKANYAIKKLNKSLMQSEESFERILFAEEVSKIDLIEIHNLEDTLTALVKLVGLCTNFYDEGLIKVGPISKANVIENFNSVIQAIMRREKTPFVYWNSTKPNEEVNFDSLYIGDAVEVSKSEIKKKKVPAFLLKEYDGKFYKIVAPMSPASKWLKGKMKPLVGGGGRSLNLKIYKFIELFNIQKRDLLKYCDNILESEKL